MSSAVAGEEHEDGGVALDCQLTVEMRETHCAVDLHDVVCEDQRTFGLVAGSDGEEHNRANDVGNGESDHAKTGLAGTLDEESGWSAPGHARQTVGAHTP